VRAELSSPEASAGASAAQLIVQELVKSNISLVVTLPDSKVTELTDLITSHPLIKTVRVGNETEGIGICCGAYFGAVNSCLFMANAGFMVTCYHLATLSMFHRIPLFMLISNRGTLGDNAHFQEYQGILTKPMLDTMGVASWVVDEPEKAPIVSKAFKHSRLYKRPAAVLLEGNAFDMVADFRYLKPGAV
jgi:sulfopyruvate decarboxylase subunit alpha